MPVGINGYMSQFADEAKLIRLNNEERNEDMEKGLERVYRWNQMLRMEFNASNVTLCRSGQVKIDQEKDIEWVLER